jgi:SAM-dependent methyltransferase
MSAAPKTANADQIAEWNGPLGERWARYKHEIEGHTAPFGEAALRAAAAQPGERVIDVGCGSGETSFRLARLVGETGEVLGVDVSEPMLAIARERLAQEGQEHLSFALGDASSAELPGGRDLIFSRFGVMFFDDPAAAFAHLRAALRPGGRIAFVCWRHPRENPWAVAPLTAARSALNHVAPPADLNAPGPFAFHDAGRLSGLLGEAGFSGVDISPFDAAIHVGASPREAAETSAKFGPLSRFVREVGENRLQEILDAVEAALAPRAEANGTVRLSGATWVVTAKA